MIKNINLTLNASALILTEHTTDDYEIQDVEGVKRIAPPLTAQTNDSTGLLLIASDSLCILG